MKWMHEKMIIIGMSAEQKCSCCSLLRFSLNVQWASVILHILLFCFLFFFPSALTAAWHKSFIRSAVCVRMRCTYIKVIELPWHHFNSENQSFSLKAQHIFYSLFNLFIKGSTAPSAISKVKQKVDTKDEYLTFSPLPSFSTTKANLVKQYAITSI